jgi:hypothetical protein
VEDGILEVPRRRYSHCIFMPLDVVIFLRNPGKDAK